MIEPLILHLQATARDGWKYVIDDLYPERTR
jgi:hypothetical protein